MADTIISPLNIMLSLLEVKCLSFSLTDYAQKNKTPIAFDKYEFEFRVETAIDEKSKAILLIFTAKLLEKQENVKYELAELKSLTAIKLINFEEIIIKNENGFGIPDQLLALCSGIAVSNTRGMYAIKLESTPYSNALIPLMDTKLFIPQKPAEVV